MLNSIFTGIKQAGANAMPAFNQVLAQAAAMEQERKRRKAEEEAMAAAAFQNPTFEDNLIFATPPTPPEAPTMADRFTGLAMAPAVGIGRNVISPLARAAENVAVKVPATSLAGLTAFTGDAADYFLGEGASDELGFTSAARGLADFADAPTAAQQFLDPALAQAANVSLDLRAIPAPVTPPPFVSTPTASAAAATVPATNPTNTPTGDPAQAPAATPAPEDSPFVAASEPTPEEVAAAAVFMGNLGIPLPEGVAGPRKQMPIFTTPESQARAEAEQEMLRAATLQADALNAFTRTVDTPRGADPAAFQQMAAGQFQEGMTYDPETNSFIPRDLMSDRNININRSGGGFGGGLSGSLMNTPIGQQLQGVGTNADQAFEEVIRRSSPDPNTGFGGNDTVRQAAQELQAMLATTMDWGNLKPQDLEGMVHRAVTMNTGFVPVGVPGKGFVMVHPDDVEPIPGLNRGIRPKAGARVIEPNDPIFQYAEKQVSDWSREYAQQRGNRELADSFRNQLMNAFVGPTSE